MLGEVHIFAVANGSSLFIRTFIQNRLPGVAVCCNREVFMVGVTKMGDHEF